MDDHSVDLVVIGAGASGASVAYEAVRRGLSVALLEGGGYWRWHQQPQHKIAAWRRAVSRTCF